MCSNTMKPEDFYRHLCWNDKRHPDFLAYEDDTIHLDLPCYCDNCFYGRTALALTIIQILHEHSLQAKAIEELKKLFRHSTQLQQQPEKNNE